MPRESECYSFDSALQSLALASRRLVLAELAPCT
jgi:hypothetical protein